MTSAGIGYFFGELNMHSLFLPPSFMLLQIMTEWKSYIHT